MHNRPGRFLAVVLIAALWVAIGGVPLATQAAPARVQSLGQENAAQHPGLQKEPEGSNVLLSPAASSVPGTRFVHTATADNIAGNTTYIDHPLTNNNPSAVILVTQNWNPGGSSGTYNDHAIGVWYSNSAKKWGIFNQDGTAMQQGVDFNVLIPDSSADTLVHTATAANTDGHITYIDHPLTNNNPNAVVSVTQNWNPGGGIYNDHAIGVWYSNSAGKWAIFNQDIASMPEGASFNVLIAADDTAFVHTATAANTTGQTTYIDHPLTNNNPNAILLVTQNWKPGSGSGTYNDHAIGVWYNSTKKKWAIFNQDVASIPEGAGFNVLIPDSNTDVLVHTATTANTIGQTTYIDHPLTNNNPNAIFLVTQNWNPGGSGSGTYNAHPIGVWYNSTKKKWGVFNQNIASMPEGAAFNVLIPPPGANVFVHTATVANTDGQTTYIDHPLTNNNPNALLLVTQNWNPGGSIGTYNNHAIGVWYVDSENKWAIFNQDVAPMPEGAKFNVMVLNDLFALPGTKDAFLHTATAASISGNWSAMDHPLTNQNPVAFVFTTANWNPGGGSGTYNDHVTGVWYSNAREKWAVFNQDIASIPEGASFNVLVVTPRLYLPLIIR